MSTALDILGIRRRLGRQDWGVPREFGPDGWMLDNLRGKGRIIVSYGPQAEDLHDNWVHASISRVDELPTYEDLVIMHAAIFPDGWAYQVFAPPAEHVNIHSFVLHLWGRLDGSNDLPNFGALGTI